MGSRQDAAYVACRPPTRLEKSHLSEERMLAESRHGLLLATDEDFHGTVRDEIHATAHFAHPNHIILVYEHDTLEIKRDSSCQVLVVDNAKGSEYGIALQEQDLQLKEQAQYRRVTP